MPGGEGGLERFSPCQVSVEAGHSPGLHRPTSTSTPSLAFCQPVCPDQPQVPSGWPADSPGGFDSQRAEVILSIIPGSAEARLTELKCDKILVDLALLELQGPGRPNTRRVKL